MERYSTEELRQLKEAVHLIDKYKFSDVFGDISGALQKVIDVMEISATAGDNKNLDFISPEKVPHIKGSEYLSAIIRAIQEKKVIRLVYHPFYEDKAYFSDIHPYLLKEYKNRWYMIGLNDFKNQLRTYSLDRIRDIQDSDLKYITQNFSAREYFRNSIGIISPEGDPPRIKVAVQKTQAQYIISQPWHESQNIEDENEEMVVFSFKVHPSYEFISLLLSFGKDVKVLEPASLQVRMKSEITAMLSYYS